MPLLAHGIGGRSDLPVPLWLAMYAAGFAVVASFVVLGALWLEPKLRGALAGHPLPGPVARFADSRAFRVALRAIGVLGAVITTSVALFGDDSSASNPAPTWLYVWFWVGLVPASLLFGPVWRRLNPLRAFSTGLARLAGGGDAGWRPYPEKLGYWPAALSLLIFVWLELVYGDADRPLTVAAFLLFYGLVHTVAGSLFGPVWHRRGDGFEVYSALIGLLAPIGRRSDGRLVVRNPLDGLASLESKPGLVATVCVVLGSTAFDGLTRTDAWTDLAQGTTGLANLALGSAGLIASMGFIAVTYTGATKLSASLARGSSPSPVELDRRFVHSLVPIAVGYTIAHYFSLFVFQGQAGYILASDPLGQGWDLFGTANLVINYATVSTSAIAWVQVVAIVIGHIVGVVAAHDRAVGTFTGRDKLRAQYALLGVMVLYTVGGIGLLVGS